MFSKPLVSELCEYCHNIFDYWPEILEGGKRNFQHYKCYKALLASARNGCRLCAQFERDSSSEDLLNDGFRPVKGEVVVKSGQGIPRDDWSEGHWRLELTLPYIENAEYGSNQLGFTYNNWEEGAGRYLKFSVEMVPALDQGKLSLLLIFTRLKISMSSSDL
jgi:hypothetical protein